MQCMNLADPQTLSAINRQVYTCDKYRFIAGEKQGGVGHIPGSPHLFAKWYPRVSCRDNLFSRLASRLSIAFDGHGRIHQARQNRVGANTVSGITHGDILGQCQDRCLGSLVGHHAGCGPGSD